MFYQAAVWLLDSHVPTTWVREEGLSEQQKEEQKIVSQSEQTAMQQQRGLPAPRRSACQTA
jgi:hypothetical protein